MKLLTEGKSVFKIAKSDKVSKIYRSSIMFLLPHKLSGKGNLCPHASPGCILSCLNTSGMGKMNCVQRARLNRTMFYLTKRADFLDTLMEECERFIKRSNKNGYSAAIRLNGLSDIPWEKVAPGLFNLKAQFYDYTKNYSRMIKFLDKQFPETYHLTFSRSEINDKESKDILSRGGSVAYVFHKKRGIPSTWLNHKVHNGELHDLRFQENGLIGLLSKGRANHDITGFVIR